MSIAMLMTLAALVPCLAYAAGPTNPSDRYDYNMRSTNKDGYVPDTARATNKEGYVPDTERATNREGYIPDTAKTGDKFDPYTQGAKQPTASALTDVTSAPPKARGTSHSHKKTPSATEK